VLEASRMSFCFFVLPIILAPAGVIDDLSKLNESSDV